MATDTVASDKAIGAGVLFSLLAVGGAAAMLATSDQLTTAWAFAGAVVAATAAVAALHAFGD